MSNDKQTTFEPFIEKSGGYTQMGIRITNPPEWLVRKVQEDEEQRERLRNDMARMLYGEVAE